MHTRIEAGKFSRSLGAGGWSAPVLSSCRYWINRAAVMGESCGDWARAAFNVRGPESLRAIMGLCELIKKHSAVALNAACAKAIKSGTYRLKDGAGVFGNQSLPALVSYGLSIRGLSSHRRCIETLIVNELAALELR
jgi:hypothetical protein